MMFLSVITQAMDMARRKFTRGEQSMLIDIFNGTALTPGILGQHLIAQVEDSFADIPGEYEQKWEVNRQEMVDKIVSLDPVSAAFLELWAVGFWALQGGDVPPLLEDYIAGRIDLARTLGNVLARLDASSERLEGTKSSFKSPVIADVRSVIDVAADILKGMI